MLFTEAELRARGEARTKVTAKSAEQILIESRDSISNNFDVFLSHSILDKIVVVGAKQVLEEQGLSVYVDWIADPKLDRTQVTVDTAAHLRHRMKQCKMLVYLHSGNAAVSRWCPWELGYFDGLRGGNVFILPAVGQEQHSFIGQEYLGLYPYLNRTTDNRKILVMRADAASFIEGARTKVLRRAEH